MGSGSTKQIACDLFESRAKKKITKNRKLSEVLIEELVAELSRRRADEIPIDMLCTTALM